MKNNQNKRLLCSRYQNKWFGCHGYFSPSDILINKYGYLFQLSVYYINLAFCLPISSSIFWCSSIVLQYLLLWFQTKTHPQFFGGWLEPLRLGTGTPLAIVVFGGSAKKSIRKLQPILQAIVINSWLTQLFIIPLADLCGLVLENNGLQSYYHIAFY